MIKISPSILSANFLNLEADIKYLNEYADYFHLDIMDGVFVPNISFGFPICEAIATKAEIPLDVHLMIVNPGNYIDKVANIKGVEMISFHLEAVKEPIPLLNKIKSYGIKAGLVINPDVPVLELEPYFEFCDYVLIMSVQAGFGGQSFNPNTYERLSQAREIINNKNLTCELQVDGGVSLKNSSALIAAGANILVSGTSVFTAQNPGQYIKDLRGE